MSGTGFDQSEQTESAAKVADAEPACVALVPFTPALHWTSVTPCLSRPDPCFVTQLIATAEQAPQTRTLRRASSADAQTAYTASRHPIQGAGGRTRQII
jgi:hypothetical protein